MSFVNRRFCDFVSSYSTASRPAAAYEDYFAARAHSYSVNQTYRRHGSRSLCYEDWRNRVEAGEALAEPGTRGWCTRGTCAAAGGRTRLGYSFLGVRAQRYSINGGYVGRSFQLHYLNFVCRRFS